MSRIVWLDDLDLSHMVQGWERPQRCRSCYKAPLSVGGRRYERGVGTHAEGSVSVKLGRGTLRFLAEVGVDDCVGLGQVGFAVIGDGRHLWSSGTTKGREPAKAVDLDISTVDVLELVVEAPDGNTHHGHADWCDARFVVVGEDPRTFTPEKEPAVRLTPPTPPPPRFNGPAVLGVRPGSPILFTVPVSGIRPMRLRAAGLPPGLALDEASGVLSGSLPNAGEYRIPLCAENDAGRAERVLRLVSGRDLALTPPMGWNSWNGFGLSVTQEDVAAAAQAMVDLRLIDFGFSYVNTDDGWQGERGGSDLALQPNDKFPDLAGLVAGIHGLGLKAGIYSTPWVRSCGGLVGGSSYSADGQDNEVRKDRHPIGPFHFAVADASQWAAWGFDHLKYDWSPEIPSTVEIRHALDHCGRDLVLSLSSPAPLAIIERLAQLAQTWRTASDLIDTWFSVRAKFLQQKRWASVSGPGHWNDPDMLVVGAVGPGWSNQRRPTRLSPHEQYLHVGMWAMLAAPLLVGCDLTRLDDFTRGLLTNPEIIDIDQDPLGRQAVPVAVDLEAQTEVWTRPLADGSRALALVNLARQTRRMAVTWNQIDMAGRQRVRDAWRCADETVADQGYACEVPGHFAKILRLAPVEH